MDDIRAQGCDIVPPGWMHLDQLGVALGNLSQSQTRKNVHALLSAGRVDRKRFRIVTDCGKSSRTVWHYKLK